MISIYYLTHIWHTYFFIDLLCASDRSRDYLGSRHTCRVNVILHLSLTDSLIVGRHRFNAVLVLKNVLRPEDFGTGTRRWRLHGDRNIQA
jgi:hypothetical protein